MNEQWQELKETIIEMRDSNGTATQQEACKFLANYMDVLEKQIQKSTKRMKYGYCVYHKLECDYDGQCVNCPYNTNEDIEWFKQEEEKAERED